MVCQLTKMMIIKWLQTFVRSNDRRACSGNNRQYSALYANNGYDGVIQIISFLVHAGNSCKKIFPSIERDLDIPILTLIIDEMTGEAGYMTRVEAFIDILEKRRERVEMWGKLVLSGN